MPLVAKEQSARQKAETDVRTIHKGIDGLRAELDETVKERANHDRNTKKLQTELDANSKLSKANIETKSLEEKLKKTEAEAKAAADKARQGGGKVSPEEIKRAQQEIEHVRDEIEKERTQRTALEKKARELATEIDDIREAIEDDPFLNKDSFAPTAPSKTSSPMLLSLKRLTRRGRISPRLSQRNENKKYLEISELRKQPKPKLETNSNNSKINSKKTSQRCDATSKRKTSSHRRRTIRQNRFQPRRT